MSEERNRDFERRSRAAFDASIDAVDMRTRSRLTQARHAALDAAAGGRRPFAGVRLTFWAPALLLGQPLLLCHGGLRIFQSVVGIALWTSRPSADVSGFEDLELVASNEQMDLLQDDPEFYDWVDKAPVADTAGSG